MIMERCRSWHATHNGTRRKHNEDNWVDRPDLGEPVRSFESLYEADRRAREVAVEAVAQRE